MLAALANNGGATQTHRLFTGSPAIDKGAAATDPITNTAITTDQRGFPRPVDDLSIPNAVGGNGSDIGAFELEPAAQAAVYTVDTTDDNAELTACTPAANDCSLRGAIANANANGQADTINFDTTVFAAHQTITPGGTELVKQNNGSLTINGPAAGVTISGNNASRVLLNLGTAVSLQNLTITGGAQGSGPLINGAGIYNAGGTMTLTKVTVSGNTSGFEGGGIINAGDTMTLTDSTVSSNSATYAGGISNNVGTMTLTDSTVRDNSATVWGGGIFSDFATVGTVTITNSTISGNTASFEGGGIYVYAGTLTLANSTVTNNSSEFGAIRNYIGIVNVRSTIIAGNTDSDGGAPDVAGAFISQGYNLVGASDYSSGFVNGANNDQVGTVASPINPLLGALQDNGGLTETHALLPGSPAIDRGNSFGLTTDQRGFARPVDFPLPNAPGGDGSDIGAFEAGKEQCKEGGWKILGNGTFSNQGQCVSFVNTGR